MERQILTRRQLYDLVWKEPVQALAARFGLSDRGLGKLCERHAIPTPPRGYWARKQAGQRVIRTPLLELDGPDGRIDFPVLSVTPPRAPMAATAAASAPDPLIAFWENQKQDIGAVPVAKTLANPHRVVADWLAIEQRARENRARWGGFAVHSTDTPLERRRLRLLSALYKALEARGVSVECPPNSYSVTLRHQRDETKFDLKEYVAQKRRPLSEQERAERWTSKAKWRVEQTPSGLLRGKVDVYLPESIPTTWTESAERPFEDMLGEIAATILTALAKAKFNREVREADERRRWAEAEAARKREEAEKIERARKQALRQRAEHWRRAEDLRAYVAAVESAAQDGRFSADPETLATWRTWALAHAAELDPLLAGDALETSGR